MPIPKAVQQQADRADQMAREAGLTGVPPAQSQDPAPKPAAPQPSGPTSEQSQEQRQTASASPNEDYKVRYERLRASRDERRAELERQNGILQGKLEMVHSELESLRQEVSQIRSTPAPQPTTTVSPLDVSQFLTGDEAEYFTPEALNIIAQVATRIAQGTVANEIAPMRSQLDGMQRKQFETDDQFFWRVINSEIPHWRELTNVPEFEDYMAERDPLLGMTRQQAVNEAQKNLNHERIIAIYRQYTGPRPSHIDDSGNPPEPPIHPDDAGGNDGTEDIDEVPTIKKSFVDKFYQDVANKRYVGREEEAARIDAQIMAAGKAGKIVPG